MCIYLEEGILFVFYFENCLYVLFILINIFKCFIFKFFFYRFYLKIMLGCGVMDFMIYVFFFL